MKRKFEIGDLAIPNENICDSLREDWINKYSPLGVGKVIKIDVDTYNESKRLRYWLKYKRVGSGLYFYSWELNLVSKHEQI